MAKKYREKEIEDMTAFLVFCPQCGPIGWFKSDRGNAVKWRDQHNAMHTPKHNATIETRTYRHFVAIH